jgi:hypothetical protein
MNQEEKYQEIKKLIGEYNKIAIEENSNIRLGLAESDAYCNYKTDDINFEEFIKENGYYENASVSIEIIGAAYGWAPSSICY